MESVRSIEAGVASSPQTNPHEVVILRESELGGDLATAIRRVRADAKTARSQILIIAPEPPPSSAGIDAAPTLPPSPAATAGAIAGVGASVTHLAQDLQQFLVESERELGGLVEDIREGTRAQMQHRARVLGDIGAWIQQVAADLAHLGSLAQQGLHQVDLAALLADRMPASATARRPSVSIQFAAVAVPGGAMITTDPALASELLQAALDLVATRVGPEGTIQVSIVPDRCSTSIVVRGLGAALPIRGTGAIERLRHLAMRLGVHIGRELDGTSGATSIVLTFPTEPPRVA